jgi:hypothetical protein
MTQIPQSCMAHQITKGHSYIYLWYLKVVCTCSKLRFLWVTQSTPDIAPCILVLVNPNTVSSSVLREGGAISAYDSVSMWAHLLGNRCILFSFSCLGTSSSHEAEIWVRFYLFFEQKWKHNEEKMSKYLIITQAAVRFSVKCTWVNTKNGKKAIPVRALGGPGGWGFQRVVVRLSAIQTGLFYLPGNIPYFC